jgi:dihydroorotate dehydrogenase
MTHSVRVDAVLYRLIRPLLFSFPPHAAHRLGTAALWPAEVVAPVRALVRAYASSRNDDIAISKMGLRFATPIGIAGGFDKNATRARALAALGFGFIEVGTVTARAQEENPRPNLFRLPADRALVNRLGFPNEGAARVCARIESYGGARAIGVPLAVSIGKSRAVDVEDTDAVLADYAESFLHAHRVADFVVVNVSSPNTKNLRALQGADAARALLAHLASKNAPRKPLLLKIAPDLDDAGLDAVLAVVREGDVDGVVATNTTIARKELSTSSDVVEKIGAGGLSGPPLRMRALEVVRRARAALGPEKTVIGVGGIETAADVRAMREAGADLVQLYTSFIYEGPFVARKLARALAREGSGQKRVAEHARDGGLPSVLER